jgi:hypothetical protein
MRVPATFSLNRPPSMRTPVLFPPFPAVCLRCTLRFVAAASRFGSNLPFLPFLRSLSLFSLLSLLFSGFFVPLAVPNTASDSSPFFAVCPIVYRLDESASPRGYHYTFFGNAFFINDEGYLLTAAHVLDTFRNGGQPYILVSRADSPPRFLKVTLVAADFAHDVAILRATPNPFGGKFKVAFLSLTSEPAVPGQSVLAVSLHPARLADAQSLESPREDRSSGQVLSFASTQLDKSAAPAEIFLLSHSVTRGQSGSPVLAVDARGAAGAVVGLVEGRWLRSAAASPQSSSTASDSVSGAAVPIRYAIGLLQQHSIAWHKPAGS